MPELATKESSKSAIIVGAGLAGVTQSYFLSKEGYKVTLLEQHSSVGQEMSFLNGGLLCEGLTFPWSNMGALKIVLSSCNPFSRSSLNTIVVKKESIFDGQFIKWCLNFCTNLSEEKVKFNYVHSYTLARYSREVMLNMKNVVPFSEYGKYAKGSLQTFSDPQKQKTMFNIINNNIGKMGCSVDNLSQLEAERIEPVLAALPNPIAGAVHTSQDSSGDINAFTKCLLNKIVSLGINMRFNANVVRFVFDEQHNKVKEVVLSNGESLEADVIIIANGNGADMLAKSAGDNIMTYPIKGYVLEVMKNKDQTLPLLHNIVDDVNKIYLSPIYNGEKIRISGFAEFCGSKDIWPCSNNYNNDDDDARKKKLLELAQGFLPEGYLNVKQDCVKKHYCFRSQTPDDLPVLGRSRLYNNLYYNTGHGHIGWTRIAGSSKLVSDIICNKQPEIDPTPFFPNRFWI